MENATSALWQDVDKFLFQDDFGSAFATYREITRAGINQALEAVDNRKRHLLANSPERFKSNDEYRAEALSRLQAVQSKIIIIEGAWDGDTLGWFITLSAITEEPSQQHPQYTAYWLNDVRGFDRQVERAIEMGTELAQAAGVGFYLTDTNTLDVNYEKRWWDEQE